MHASQPEFDMPTDEQVHLAAESFRLLADPTRIKVLWALLQGESSVACLAELAGAAPTAVSQHLAKLRLAGLVRGRREGTFVYYSAARRSFARCWLTAVGAPGEAPPGGPGERASRRHVRLLLGGRRPRAR